VSLEFLKIEVQDKDPEKSKRVMAALLRMKKISIEGLKNA